MNFWRDKSLKVWASSLLAVFSLVLVAEYLIIRQSFSSFDRAERKIDFARNIQLRNQQIALQVVRYLHGSRELGGEIISLTDHQDYLLKSLGEGGRIDGTDHFIAPLTRLPRVTFNHLLEDWSAYKTTITSIIGQENPNDTRGTRGDVALTDSTSSELVTPEKNNYQMKASVLAESHWLTLSGWYERLITDLEEEVETKEARVGYAVLIFTLLDIAGLFLLFRFFDLHVLLPLRAVETSTASKSHFRGTAHKEIGAVAQHINHAVEDLQDATDFVVAIGSGNLDLDYKSLDGKYIAGKNKLADSLIEMQARLKAMNEEEQKRQWSNEGLAKFVDILRSTNDNLTLLCDKIVASLVQYTHSNQGGLYILNEEDKQHKYLELISLFAFDIKKFEQQRIKPGEGILGQTYLEKETTYLTNLPADYIRITSGLGDANPKSILMVPLKVDTRVYGIIELASFNEYLPHEIAFVEKLGESIASTLASVRASQRNRQLIEQFQQQTEQMRAQEEEMRQNMEELQATQEEIARKEKSYIDRIAELESESSLNEMKGQFDKKEQEYLAQLAELTRQLSELPSRGDDWEIAQEVERALRINLEALQITKEELDSPKIT